MSRFLTGQSLSDLQHAAEHGQMEVSFIHRVGTINGRGNDVAGKECDSVNEMVVEGQRGVWGVGYWLIKVPGTSRRVLKFIQ